jgi:hypothetical protein
MEFNDELKEEPVYEEPQREKPVVQKNEIEATDVFADKIATYEAAIAEAAAAEAEAEEAETSENMVMMQGRQEEASYSASQSYAQGYSLYEQAVASDWWYWTLQIDATDGFFAEGEVFYQWVTLVNQADSSDAFTIGCKMAKGSEDMVVDYFTMDGDNDALAAASALVTPDITWDSQAPDLKEDDEDHEW